MNNPIDKNKPNQSTWSGLKWKPDFPFTQAKTIGKMCLIISNTISEKVEMPEKVKI